MSIAIPARSRVRAPGLVVTLCFITIVFDGYDLIVYGSMVPSLLAEPGWALTPQRVGAIAAVTLLGMFVGAVVVGMITDSVGRRKTAIGCIALFSGAMLCCALAPTPELLGLARFVAGLGLGGVAPTLIALVVEIAPANRKHLYNSAMLAGFPIGGVVAAVVAISYLESFGFRFLFALGGLPLLTIVPLLLRYLPESPSYLSRAAGSAATSDRISWRDRFSVFGGRLGLALLLFCLANFASMLIIYGLNTWLPQLMRSAGYPLGSALLFLGVLNIGAVLGGLGGSYLADRVGGRYVTAGAFVIATVAIFSMGSGLPTVALYVAIGIAGATTIGTQIVLFGHVATYFDAAVRATSLGWATGIGRLGAVVGPLLGGYLAQAQVGLAVNFQAFAVVALVGAVCAVLVPARVAPEPAVTERVAVAPVAGA